MNRLKSQTTFYLNAANKDFTFGFKVIPLKQSTKITIRKWDPWLSKLSKETIQEHWKKHPIHEVGIIVGDNMIVFDADTKESLAKLYEFEKVFDIHPNHIVKTVKGEHHYFYRSNDVIAKSNSHSTEQYPDRIDVKTGRSMVVRPPSTGKEMEIDEAESVDDFTPVTQEFVDAINLHNGIRKVDVSNSVISQSKDSYDNSEVKIINDLLKHISATCNRDEWIRVGMAIYYEMTGSIEGMEVWNKWSSTGKNYCGYEVIKYQYLSFKNNHQGHKFNLITLANLAEENGANSFEIQMQFDEDFEVIDEGTIVIHEQVDTKTKPLNPLDKYSLRGKSAEYESQISEEQFVAGNIILKGQVTIIYAQYNTGKTLIVISLLMKAINDELVNATDVYYINADDNHRGLVTKLLFADEFGFNMLAPGHNGFEVKNFTESLIEMTKNGTAKDAIVIVDTLKKFTNLMDKSQSSKFAQIARQFVSKGGTILLLAHVNKRKTDEGKSIHAGTTDIMDDCDCAYILETVTEKDGIKTVQFENTKSRGCVASKAAYQYAVEDDISYTELIASVSFVDDIDAEQLVKLDEGNGDESCVDAIIKRIGEGINTKMKLAEVVAKDIGQSKRKVIKIIEKYTGDDKVTHKWTFKVKERGAKVYELLPPPENEKPTKPQS